MSTRRRTLVVGWLALLVGLGLGSTHDALARPTYFEVFTSRYGITPSDRLYACGNCHFLWTGTGGRNAYGSAVEQQLYIGKSISQALADVEALDSDGDGFSNLDEITVFDTLAGYSCNDFYLAQGAPAGYDTYITPMVASCLQPKAIRLSPTTMSFFTKTGTVGSQQLQLINNGSTDPITVDSYQLLAGAPATLAVSGPATPFQIPVGQQVALDVTFSPTAATLLNATLRVVSDDPIQGTIDVPIQGFGIVQNLAAADRRERCLKSVDGAFRHYADRHRREWNQCFVDEVAGQACDAGARDLEVAQAEQRFRDEVGGSKDRVCAGDNLTPSSLGLPTTCGGSCDGIALDSMSSYASCLVCQEDQARDDLLRAAVGTAPPDVPPNTAGSSAANRCQKQLASRLAKGSDGIQKILDRYELANITGTVVDCAAANATAIADIQAKVNAAVNRCGDSTGLLACPYDGGAATCLGDAAGTVSGYLSTAIFGAP